MVISVYPLPFIATVSFGNKQKSRGAKSSAETNPPNSTFQVTSATCFPTGEVRFRCSHVYLWFVLLEQIHNAQLCEC